METEPIYMQVEKITEMWRELWYKMADGIKSEYDKIKATDLFEFYHLFDLWNEKLKRETKAFQTKTRRNG